MYFITAIYKSQYHFQKKTEFFSKFFAPTTQSKFKQGWRQVYTTSFW